MKIEKLRNNHKKEIIIGTILLVVIGGALTFRLTHSKYRVTQSIDLGSGVINYKVPDFKIMAMYKNDGSGDVSIDSMPTSGYVINEDKTYCWINSGSQVKGKIKTISGNHVISGLNKGDKCYLYFDKQKLGADQILANVSPKTTSPDFSKAATTDEGVYSITDGMYTGTTYYWRGAATTNHVIFANKCWRIVRINGDKTIRLIYNGGVLANNTCFGNGANADSIAVTSTSYNLSKDRSEYAGWTYKQNYQRPSDTTEETEVDSNAKKQTEIWFLNSFTESQKKQIADGKYCNDRNISSGSWTSEQIGYFKYAGSARSGRITNTSATPTLICDVNDIYTLKAGAITVDEAIMAGSGKWATSNSAYYLYNNTTYWTMSPEEWQYSGVSFKYVTEFVVSPTGQITSTPLNDTDSGLRPVINLCSDVTFSSGDGTQNSPYVVS